MNQYEELIKRFELNESSAQGLRKLESVEIVLMCDDSGSMCDSVSEKKQGYTRWDELSKICKTVVEIATVFDKNGLDIYFLNRPDPERNVRTPQKVEKIFEQLPAGTTPIANVLREILSDKKTSIQERKLLILIATDGMPTDWHGNPNTETLKKILIDERPDNVYCSFLACTDDKKALKYFEELDKIKNTDCTDDYWEERRQILKKQGPGYSFSYGDYIVKALTGSLDQRLDKQDEVKLSRCCVIL